LDNHQALMFIAENTDFIWGATTSNNGNYRL